jgi:hypothetical protein
MPESPPRAVGGDPLLLFLLVGTGSVVERFASAGEDGLAAAVGRLTDGAVTLHITRAVPEGGRPLFRSLPETCAAAATHPVTVLVFDGDLPDQWPDDLDDAKRALDEGVRALKALGTRLIVIGVSTLDPSRPSDEARADERTAHELELALLELSVDEGISVLDTDRIVAELGGADHVESFLRYDDAVLDRLVTTMVEILADYGFFEARPLVPQVGVRNR